MYRIQLRKLERSLKDTLQSSADTDRRLNECKMGSKMGSGEAIFLVRLQEVLSALALKLRLTIKDLKNAEHCNLLALKNAMCEAERRYISADMGLGDWGDGSFTQRKERADSAEKSWWDSMNAVRRHRAVCSACVARRSPLC